MIRSLFQTGAGGANWFLAPPANSQIPSLVFYHKEEEDDSVDNVDHDYSEIAKGGFLKAARIAVCFVFGLKSGKQMFVPLICDKSQMKYMNILLRLWAPSS